MGNPHITHPEFEKGIGDKDLIIGKDDLILVTGATGFIGSKVVDSLLGRGFRNIRCFARPSSDESKVAALSGGNRGEAHVEVLKGNLLSREDCASAVKGASVIIHLAAGTGTKSFADGYLNSVVTTRNLLEADVEDGSVKRFVNVSSFAVYKNRKNPGGNVLDETSPVETQPALRGNAYCFAKVKQDDIVEEYGKRYGLSFVTVRPGYVYGAGHEAIPSRVGIGTFGIFLHLGGPNKMPLTYVDNCADAIALAGIKKLDAECKVFNVVDDDLPSSRHFLRLYKKKVRRFSSIYLPHFISYSLCCLWEWYSNWSEGQLASVYNRSAWYAYWKKTRYSNVKLKTQLGWRPIVPTAEALSQYFESCREGGEHA